MPTPKVDVKSLLLTGHSAFFPVNWKMQVKWIEAEGTEKF